MLCLKTLFGNLSILDQEKAVSVQATSLGHLLSFESSFSEAAKLRLNDHVLHSDGHRFLHPIAHIFNLIPTSRLV